MGREGRRAPSGDGVGRRGGGGEKKRENDENSKMPFVLYRCETWESWNKKQLIAGTRIVIMKRVNMLQLTQL